MYPWDTDWDSTIRTRRSMQGHSSARTLLPGGGLQPMEVSTMFRYYMSFLLLWLLVLSNTYAGEVVTVIAKDYKFQPQEITVKVGTTVRWENHEKRQYHSAWFEVLGEEPGDYFFPGDVRERTFDKPGSYPYICEPHVESHQMKGVVHVVE
ncbi:MAG: hypothetical protein DBO99_00345 [gamma proteobacterium symbiont of Ctena orbiculata]|nr:MAG: hypothetical protein DBO99_00345 [gamma proteobacterium symbiont of Ctena orbiculata]